MVKIHRFLRISLRSSSDLSIICDYIVNSQQFKIVLQSFLQIGPSSFVSCTQRVHILPNDRWFIEESRFKLPLDFQEELILARSIGKETVIRHEKWIPNGFSGSKMIRRNHDAFSTLCIISGRQFNEILGAHQNEIHSRVNFRCIHWNIKRNVL